MSSTKSTSAAAARRAAQEASRAPAPVLAAEVERYVASYKPLVIATEDWRRVRRVVIDAVTASGPSTAERAKQLLLPAAKLAVWACSRGVPLERERLFTQPVIEEWARAQIAAGVPEKSVATMRSHLRAVAGPAPSPTKTISRSPVQVPYTAADELRLRRAVTGQRSPVYRSHGCLIYGLGRGAGLTASDLRTLRDTDVIDHLTGGIEVHLADRSVWVLDSCADVVRTGLPAEPTGAFLVGGTNGSRKNVGEYVDRFTMPKGTPRLVIGRCRTSWLAEHLRLGTPIDVVRDAFGTKSITQLWELLELVDDREPLQVARHLRGIP